MKRFDTVTQNKSDKIEVKRVITFHRISYANNSFKITSNVTCFSL